MLNALSTLPFLLTLAVAILAITHTLEGSGAKILAALRGQFLLARTPVATRPVVVRYAPRQAPVRAPVKTAARLRAAA